MKINLQAWALVAEIIGGVSIVITLAFLVIETRENTNAIQAQTYQSLTAELNDVRIVYANNIQAISDARNEESSTGLAPELVRLKALHILGAKWGVYESAFYARERNVLGDLEWNRFETTICSNLNIDSAFWGQNSTQPGYLRIGLTEHFAEFVENTCNWKTVSSSADT